MLSSHNAQVPLFAPITYRRDMRRRDRPKRRVVIHIGTHKTGTTAFQRYLLENRTHFSRAGLHLHVHESGSPQAHELPLLALRSDLCIPLRVRNPDLTLAEARPNLESAIRSTLASVKHGTVLFSHEALSFLRHQEETEALAQLFPEDEVQIVVTLRDPTAYLKSWSAQLKRMGFATSSPYRTSFMYTESDSWLADFNTLESVYRQTFGSDSVTVVSYERALTQTSSVVPSLLEAVGIPIEDLPPGWDEYRNTRAEESRF